MLRSPVFAMVLVATLFAGTAHAEFFVEDGKVKSEVQTYELNGKSIVFIDMIHVGPKDFYTDVRDTLSRLRNSDALILQEGVGHCAAAGDEFYIPGANAKFDQLVKLLGLRREMSEQVAVQKILEAGFVKQVCKQGETGGQRGLLDRALDRFSLYGLVATFGFMRSQGSVAVYPKGIPLASGDISSGRFVHASVRALAGSVVQCMLAIKSEGGCAVFKSWAATNVGKTYVDQLIIELRNDVLLAKTFSVLDVAHDFGGEYSIHPSFAEKKFKTVILPWGADHMTGGLTDVIESVGFKKSGRSGIDYVDCKRLKKNVILNAIFQDNAKLNSDCRR